VRGRIDGALRYYNTTLKGIYRRMLQYYTGNHWGTPPGASAKGDLPDVDLVVVNRIMPSIHIKVATLGFQDPEFYVRCPGCDDDSREEEELKVRELMKSTWRRIQAQDEIRLLDLDRRLFGYGISRIGWWLEEQDGMIRVDEPRLSRVSPGRFLTDLDLTRPSLKHARWCAEVLYIPIEELQQNTEWEHVDKVVPTATEMPRLLSPANLADPKQSVARKSSTRPGYAVIYDYWDRQTGVHMIVPEAPNDLVLMIEEDPFGFDDFFPFEILPNIIVPDMFYGISDPESVENQQLEINKLRSLSVTHAGRALPRLLTKQGALSPRGEKALEAGSTDVAVEVDGEYQGPMEDAARPLHMPNMNTEHRHIEFQSRIDFDEIIGVNDFKRGTPLGTKRTATEVQQIAMQGGVRAEDDQQVYERFLKRNAEKLYHVLRRFQDQPLVLEIVLPNGQSMVAIKPSELPENSEIDIVTGSTAFQDRAQERADMLTLTGYLAQIPVPIPPHLDPIVRRALRTFDLRPNEVDEIMDAMAQPPGGAGGIEELLAGMGQGEGNGESGGGPGGPVGPLPQGGAAPGAPVAGPFGA